MRVLACVPLGFVPKPLVVEAILDACTWGGLESCEIVGTKVGVTVLCPHANLGNRVSPVHLDFIWQ